MDKKIALFGAGSAVFGPVSLSDMFLSKVLPGITIVLVDIYKDKPQLGFKVVGEFNNLTEFELSDLNKKKIDDVLQSDSSISKSDALDLLTYCQENQIHLKYVASLFQAQNQNADLQSLAGLPIIEGSFTMP